MKELDDLGLKLQEIIVKFNLEQEKPIYQTSKLRILAEQFRDEIYSFKPDELKEEANSLAISIFRDYLDILRDDGSYKGILDFLYNDWWSRIGSILFMYADNLNSTRNVTKVINRFLAFIVAEFNGQDPRLTCAPESMIKMYVGCKNIISFMESEDTLETLRSRYPTYFENSTIESQNGGTINDIKIKMLTALLELLKNKGTDLSKYVRNGEICATSEFNYGDKE